MNYKYCENNNYEDFASGRVLYNDKTITNFPIRLSQEIFMRCLEYSDKKSDLCIYDCCCGGGYMLTTLGFMNAKNISELIGSDINQNSIEIARQNMGLLSEDGLDLRIKQIQEMYMKYHKESHLEAEKSAIRLKELLENTYPKTKAFVADAFGDILLSKTPDIIITDIPYGELVSWEGKYKGDINLLLDNLYNVCSEDTIIAICMNKSQKIKNDKFTRLEKQQIGKRRFEILKKK